MMAAISAAEINKNICLLERNEELGKKLLMTGKERCNLTSSKTIREIVEAFGPPRSHFLFSSFSQFSNEDIIKFFEKRGVKTKIERGDRVFPADDRSESVLACLEKELRKSQVRIEYNFRVKKVTRDGKFFQIESETGDLITTENVIIATGGRSYPATGSTGDGYEIAKSLGHTINKLKPALVAMVVTDPELRALSGLALKNIELSFWASDQLIDSYFGEMLFTHFGISGPVVLTASKKIYEVLEKGVQVRAEIDLKPALDEDKLYRRLQREMETIGKKEYHSLLETLLPKSLIEYAIKKTEIDAHYRIGSLTREQKTSIVNFLKNFSFLISATMPIETGIVTAGGVEINEINGKTMESKLIPHLYFAGEIIDLPGPTGGYNLTKAFSTGYVAGRSAATLKE